MERNFDADYVYLCNFLLSRPFAQQWERVAAKNKSPILHYFLFPRRDFWRGNEYENAAVCRGQQCADIAVWHMDILQKAG